MVNLHRILSGSPEHRTELMAAGIFVMVWFTIDAIQWVDWAVSKFSQPQQVVCIPIGTSALTLPLTQNN